MQTNIICSFLFDFKGAEETAKKLNADCESLRRQNYNNIYSIESNTMYIVYAYAHLLQRSGFVSHNIMSSLGCAGQAK